MLALLRCIPTNIPTPNLQPAAQGDAVYSGRSIGQVSLATLRKNFTIVPQTVGLPSPTCPLIFADIDMPSSRNCSKGPFAKTWTHSDATAKRS